MGRERFRRSCLLTANVVEELLFVSCYDANSCMCEKCRREIFGTVAFLPSEEEGSASGRNGAPAKGPLGGHPSGRLLSSFSKIRPRTGLFPEILPTLGPLWASDVPGLVLGPSFGLLGSKTQKDCLFWNSSSTQICGTASCWYEHGPAERLTAP